MAGNDRNSKENEVFLSAICPQDFYVETILG